MTANNQFYITPTISNIERKCLNFKTFCKFPKLLNKTDIKEWIKCSSRCSVVDILTWPATWVCGQGQASWRWGTRPRSPWCRWSICWHKCKVPWERRDCQTPHCEPPTVAACKHSALDQKPANIWIIDQENHMEFSATLGLVIRPELKLETLQLCGWLERNFHSNLADNFTNVQSLKLIKYWNYFVILQHSC